MSSCRPLKVDPPTSASGFLRKAAMSFSSQVGVGRQSSSVKAMNSPRASAAPRLRAPAGPVFCWRTSLSSNFVAHRAGSSARGGSLPSSTTMTSKALGGSVCAARDSRHDSTAAGRLRVGMTTLASGVVMEAGVSHRLVWRGFSGNENVGAFAFLVGGEDLFLVVGALGIHFRRFRVFAADRGKGRVEWF
jgi:hypothetical protein